jgi:hypothetical protein
MPRACYDSCQQLRGHPMSAPSTAPSIISATRVRAVAWSALCVAVLLASFGTVHTYIYCHMMQQEMASCCCNDHESMAEGAGTTSPVDELSPLCCELRQHEATATVDSRTATAESPAAPAAAALPPAAVFRPLRTVPRWVSPRKFPKLSRAGPPRRGKQRARLGVTLC